MKNTCLGVFVTGLDSGGIENYLLRFLRYKHDSFKKITIICKSGTFGELEQMFLEIPNVELVSKKVGFFNVFQSLSLFFYLRKKRFDSICDFTGDISGLVIFISYLAGIKLRTSLYRSSTNRFKETKFRLIYISIMNYLVRNFTTSILANSKAAMNFYFGETWRNKSKYEVIYNGIDPINFVSEVNDLRRELNIPMNAFVIGHTGRYNEAKNHSTIIEVAISLCRMHSDIYVLLCGKGVDLNLNSIIIENNLQNRIIALGYRSDIPRVLNTMDCYYFPSLTEGQPNALLEAMIMDLPIVASDIEPIKECLPAEFHSELVGPLEKEAAVKKISDIYKERNLSKYKHKDYVIDKFRYTDLFNKFYSRLTI